MTQDKKKYWEGFDGEEDNDEEDCSVVVPRRTETSEVVGTMIDSA